MNQARELFFDSSDDSDNENHKMRCLALKCVVSHVLNRRKSKRKQGCKRKRYERNREDGFKQIFKDYFAQNPTYPDNIFRRRFRMRKEVFLRLVEGVKAQDQYFHRRPDATGRLSISALQKCTAAMRILAYGEAADREDEYLRLSESTARLSLQHFTEAVIAKFGKQYMRNPSVEDLEEILRINAQRGFPGMIGSIDCMHWSWKNCPTAWKGQYQGRNGEASTILEVVASQDLWI